MKLVHGDGSMDDLCETNRKERNAEKWLIYKNKKVGTYAK